MINDLELSSNKLLAYTVTLRYVHDEARYVTVWQDLKPVSQNVTVLMNDRRFGAELKGD